MVYYLFCGLLIDGVGWSQITLRCFLDEFRLKDSALGPWRQLYNRIEDRCHSYTHHSGMLAAAVPDQSAGRMPVMV